MPSEIFNQFYSSTWNPNPIQRTNEPHVVTAGFFVLNYIPDPDEGVQISLGATPLYENKFNQTISNVNQYVVDYNSGAVYVDISLNGQQLTVTNYWALGLIKIYASRVELQDGTTGQDIGQTLQEFVDSIKAYTYQGEYDNSKLYEANMQVLYEGSTYIAIQSTLGHSPIDITYWRPFASGFVYKEDYSNSEQYYIRDVVSYNYGLYLCIAVPTIGTSPSNTSYWQPMFDASTIIQNAVDATTNANNCRYLGDYNGSTNYKINNIVKYNLSLYICKSNSTGNIPTNTTYWDESTKTFSWKDAYNGSTSYKVLDVVYYLGSSYVCKLDSTGNIPTNTTYWSPMALKGEKGATLSPRGAYDNAETYLENDLVFYTYGAVSGVYYAKQTTTGNVPTNTTYWEVFLQGGGNMNTATYDVDNTGVVDDSQRLGGQLPSYYTTAQNINISDSGGIYTSTEVEGALQEVKTLSNTNSSNISTITTNYNNHLLDYVRQPGYAIATGSANTYAITLSPTPTSYVDGMGISVKINVDSTSSVTINVNGLGAKTVKDSFGNNFTSTNTLKANIIYPMRYEATSENFIVQGKGGGGTATAGDILSGLTAFVNTGSVTGTLTLTGTATAGDVVSGKTFYNTDAKNIVTGTGSLKNFASGSLVYSSGNLTINSLSFRPFLVFVECDNTTTGVWYCTFFDNATIANYGNSKAYGMGRYYGATETTILSTSSIMASNGFSVSSSYGLSYYTGKTFNWWAYA